MLIAIPSDTNDGLDSTISEHFGHCAAFTLVTVTDDAIEEVSILENSGHVEGGCMAPVTLLKERGVEVLLAGGMGGRPLAGFQQVGIDVRYKEHADTVKEAVELFISGDCRAFGEAQTCGGGEGSCGGHAHHGHLEPETVAIEGKADIRDGRMVTVEYELTDADGTVLDTSSTTGPMRFIFGAGQIFPAIEQALVGLEPEAQVVKAIPASEGFGQRDESRVVEVPRAQLPPDAAVGTIVTAQNRQGQQFPMLVVHLDENVARLDGNHPLAGKDLVFEMTVKNVEDIKGAGNEPT
jgi:FKBP-type peptidyl-prolyl cis-trans isomerase 2/predicted Fe-Mo cluster-binding NifX family protein